MFYSLKVPDIYAMYINHIHPPLTCSNCPSTSTPSAPSFVSSFHLYIFVINISDNKEAGCCPYAYGCVLGICWYMSYLLTAKASDFSSLSRLPYRVWSLGGATHPC